MCAKKVVGCLLLMAVASAAYWGVSPIMAAVEDVSWGEVKNSLSRPAGKVADHEPGSRQVPLNSQEFKEYLRGGPWESRRFNDDRQLEEIQYVFAGPGDPGNEGTVTIYRKNVTTGESVEPITGKWWISGTVGITFAWTLDPLSPSANVGPDNWTNVELHVNDEADLLTLDFNAQSDKELRTLEQDRSPWDIEGLRNWLVEWVPGGSVSIGGDPSEGSVSVGNGRWVRADFTVQAADGHLPDHLQLHVEGDAQVHILSIPAYYGSEEVPQVNLCGPISGVRWTSGRNLTLVLRNDDAGGIFITGCGTARATVNVYAPEASIGVGGDDPLASIRVRTGG